MIPARYLCRMKKSLSFHLLLSPRARGLRFFAESMPTRFGTGDTLHRGRNTLEAFDTPEGKVVVKRYGKPNALNTLAYSYLRKGKARRAYEHAIRLRSLGIGTPEEIACIECRNRFGIVRESYFVSRFTDYTPLSFAAAAFPQPDAAFVLRAFARFTASLHTKGILHHDYNQSNILYRITPDGEIRFQLIDTNRMSFVKRTTRRDCIVNLRRLSCPAASYLFIVNHYAEARGWSIDDNLLKSAVSRLLFERRQQLKGGVRELHRKAHPKKRTA